MMIIMAIILDIGAVLFYMYSRGPHPDAHQAGLAAILTGVWGFVCTLAALMLAASLEINTTEAIERSIRAIPDYSNVKVECDGANNRFKGTVPVRFTYRAASFQVPYELNKQDVSFGSICGLNLQNPTNDAVALISYTQQKVSKDIEEALDAPAHALDQQSAYERYIYNIRNTIKGAESQSQNYTLTPNKQQNGAYSINEKTAKGYVPVPVPKFKASEPAFTPEAMSSTQQLLLQNISGQ